MDLASLVSNKPLLASLSREYELLKATQADINYEEWIFQRLKLAAAQQQHSMSTYTAAAYSALPGKLAHQANQQPQGGAAASNGGGAHSTGLQEHSSWTEGGELQGPSESASASTWHGGARQAAEDPQLQQPAHGKWQAQDTTNLQHQQQPGNNLRSQVSSKGPAPLWRQAGMHVDNKQQLAASSSTQPRWVAAAKLQNSLQSSKVVPAMQAAAERDRRLAATAALVREEMTLGNSNLPHQQAWRSSSLGSSAFAQLHGVGTARVQQDVQQQPLLQQLVQQNQQVQQALHHHHHQQQHQQQAFQEGQQVGVPVAHDAAAPVTNGATTDAAATAVHPSTRANPSGPQQLPEAAQNSWLVKSVLQPQREHTAAGSASLGQHAAPEFIRITGEAGRRKKPQQQHTEQPQQVPRLQEPAPGSDRRSQLKSALKQLLTSGSISGQQQQQSVAGLLQELLGRWQQQVQQQHDGQQQQLLSKLESALQVLANKQRGSSMRQRQDENMYPLEEQTEEQHQQLLEHSLSQANTALQQRRQQQRQGSATAASSRGRPSSAVRAPAGGKQLQQQQAQQREKPAWQSEPFMPAPASLLRRKRSGVVEAWDVAAAAAAARAQRQTLARPASANSPGKAGRHKPGASAPGSAKRSSRKPAAANPRSQQQQQQRWQSDAADLVSAAGCADAEFSFWAPQDAAAAGMTNAAASAAAGAGSSSSPVRSAMLTAARQKLSGRPRSAFAGAAPGGWPGMGVHGVQRVELAVQQQLQEQQQHAEAGRLTRLEETASHILGVLGRLEEQMQQPAADPSANSSALLGRAAAAAAAAGNDVLQEPAVVSNVLSALDRIEAQEQEIRRRWFGSSVDLQGATSAAEGIAAAAAAVSSVSLDCSDANSAGASLAAGPGIAAQAGISAAAVTPGLASHEPPTGSQQEQEAAITHTSLQQQQQQQQQQPEVLSKESLKAIKAGRRRFLKHQATVDGSLEVMNSPTKPFCLLGSPGGDDNGSKAAQRRAKQQLQPTYVVEAVADLLLDELLLGQVEELEGFCDALCGQLFDEEFVDA